MTDPEHFVPVAPKWWVGNFGGMVVFGVVAARSGSPAMRRGFALAAATHVVEAVYAYGAARRAGFIASAPRWAVQTLGVGFPSLIALYQARNRAASDDAWPAPRVNSGAPAQ